MEAINWKRLVRALKNEGTVLFIGPDLEKNEFGISIFQDLCKNLQKNYDGEITFDVKDGFFFFIESAAQTDVIYDMKEYYEKNNFGYEIYQKIAAIPFHLIISLSPDDSFHKVLVNNNVEHNFNFFDTYKSDVEKPSIDKPLIYNLFGLATQGKYILTQEDYFNYIKSVIADDILPTKLISSLNSATNFIFIGFDFEKWYIRLLLMILNFHLDKESKTRHAVKPENTSELLQKLIEKQFNITFIEENDLQFINTFYEKIREENMLKELKSKKEILKAQILEKLKLMSQYEEKLILGGDPKEELKWQKEVEILKSEMEDLKKQMF